MDLRLRMGKGPMLGRGIVIRGGGRPGLLGPGHPGGWGVGRGCFRGDPCSAMQGGHSESPLVHEMGNARQHRWSLH